MEILDSAVAPTSRRRRRLDPKPKNKLAVCPDCNRSYQHKSSLYLHQKYQCGKVAQLKCPHCSYITNYPGNLKSHTKNIHGDSIRSIKTDWVNFLIFFYSLLKNIFKNHKMRSIFFFNFISFLKTQRRTSIR